MTEWLVKSWYQRKLHPLSWCLIPLSALYRSIITLRRHLYRYNFLSHTRLAVPVIIVGNISVGGTGKTPVVIWLAKQLQDAGYHPGIISRGYGGHAEHYPQEVTFESLPSVVGDEPLIIHKQSQCPVVVSPNRVDAGQFLLHQHQCDVIISDDGLQHYALDRDIEIVVVDGEREFGNGYCLPTGPLREPFSRIDTVDFTLHTMSKRAVAFNINTIHGQAININQPSLEQPVESFNKQTVHAIAGIGHPARFFEQLRKKNITVIPHPFADHHAFTEGDLDFNDNYPILMTEKDAVKCQHFNNNKMWFIPIEISISGKLEHHLLTQLAGLSSHG